MDSLKLRTYKGNLTEFVKHVPEAARYLVIEKAKMAFTFPQPGNLDGVTTPAGRCSHYHNPLYTPFVILHTRQTEAG